MPNSLRINFNTQRLQPPGALKKEQQFTMPFQPHVGEEAQAKPVRRKKRQKNPKRLKNLSVANKKLNKDSPMFKPHLNENGKNVPAFNFENFDSNNGPHSVKMSVDSMGMGKGVHPDNRKIYLSGIPKNADADVVRSIFESFIGEVDDVNIIE
jgi:hypothetical protein